VERSVEQIEKFSADGRTRTVLAAGSNPVVNEARGEVYFYRDVDDYGVAVPPGLFAVNVEGSGLRPVSLLPSGTSSGKKMAISSCSAAADFPRRAAPHSVLCFEPLGAACASP